EAMIPVLEQALEPLEGIKNNESRIKNELPNSLFLIPDSVNALAVTQGPGLIGSLLMGTETANILGSIYKKPIIAVNHLEGHVYSAFAEYKPSAISDQQSDINNQTKKLNPDGWQLNAKIPKTGIFPILALVVSGGHTSLILMHDHLKYKTVAQTIDDAAGEAFDKVAKLMELGYPGGPLIERLAQKGADGTQTNADKYKLPIAMPNSLDFSFSGLKTAVLYLTKDVKSGKSLDYNKADLAASFQKTVVDTLILKTRKAIEEYQPKTVILSGGVSANSYLRKRFSRELNSKSLPEESILIPPKNLSTDNAVGIAIASALKTSSSNYVEADPNLKLSSS
ncbi:MAG: carbamoyltransferase N-terminal domain-containing protein, partial [bacterium]